MHAHPQPTANLYGYTIQDDIYSSWIQCCNDIRFYPFWPAGLVPTVPWCSTRCSVSWRKRPVKVKRTVLRKLTGEIRCRSSAYTSHFGEVDPPPRSFRPLRTRVSDPGATLSRARGRYYSSTRADTAETEDNGGRKWRLSTVRCFANDLCTSRRLVHYILARVTYTLLGI